MITTRGERAGKRERERELLFTRTDSHFRWAFYLASLLSLFFSPLFPLPFFPGGGMGAAAMEVSHTYLGSVLGERRTWSCKKKKKASKWVNMKSRDNRKCTCRKPRRDQPLFFFYPFFGVRCRWFAPCLLRVRCLPACGPSCSCLSTSRVYACLFFQYRSFVYNCRRQTLQFFLLFFFYSSVCYKHTLFIFVFSSTLVLQSSTLRRVWLWGF